MQQEDLIARFRADMARLLAAVSRVSEEQQSRTIYDDWTVKEILAHIAAWDRELVRGLDELLAGHQPAFASYPEAEFNARVVEAGRALLLADVLAEVQEAHEALVSRIEALTEEEWQRSSSYHWGNGPAMTAASLFGYSYKGETHYGGHAREIEAWTTGRA